MLRLNKKKEEAKQQQEAKAEEKGEEPMEVEGKSGDNSEQPAEGEEGAVSVLGIGGKRIQGNAAKKPTKKRTPGEIRIQKGKSSNGVDSVF